MRRAILAGSLAAGVTGATVGSCLAWGGAVGLVVFSLLVVVLSIILGWE